MNRILFILSGILGISGTGLVTHSVLITENGAYMNEGLIAILISAVLLVCALILRA